MKKCCLCLSWHFLRLLPVVCILSSWQLKLVITSSLTVTIYTAVVQYGCNGVPTPLLNIVEHVTLVIGDIDINKLSDLSVTKRHIPVASDMVQW